jgi:hypothetical protein
MPIRLSPCVSDSCTYAEWSIDAAARDRLVETLAYLYLFQEENALRVIAALDPTLRPSKGRVAQNVIDKLTAPKPKTRAALDSDDVDVRKKAEQQATTQVEHRDGLLFQYVSWVAARIEMPNAHLTAPHVRSADKGFDGFIVELDSVLGTLERMVICEDKASVDPRPLITGSVWKEIEAILAGMRDDQLLAALTVLVASIPGLSHTQREVIIDGALWHESRQFRVSVATGANIGRDDGFGHVLKGFDLKAPGPMETRMGGVLPFPDVRQGLAALAQDVATCVGMIDARAQVAYV